jgi:N-acetylneuraminate synthase
MTYVIAEIGINHNGDIDLAKELIDMAHDSGCDAVKFQKRDIESVYSEEELNKYRESPWGTLTREQKHGIEFDIVQYKELEKYTDEKGLDFIVSCWDLNSLQEVEDNLNVKYHKVASAMATDKEFLEKLHYTGKSIILSTGMCTDEQVDAALKILKNTEYLLACTSTYPTKEEEINLKYITTLKEKYPHLSIGFSNHYSGLVACIGATALGAECLEFHITKDRAMYGSDQIASIESVGELMTSVNKIQKMLGDGEKVVYDSEKPIIDKLRKIENTI